MTVRFMYNGIKIDGTLYKAWYSKDDYTPESGIQKDTISMYADSYKRIPRIAGLSISNDTDSMSDYFETDTIRITPDSQFYAAALEGYKKYEEKRAKRSIAWIERKIEKEGKRSSWYSYRVQRLNEEKARLARVTA